MLPLSLILYVSSIKLLSILHPSSVYLPPSSSFLICPSLFFHCISISNSKPSSFSLQSHTQRKTSLCLFVDAGAAMSMKASERSAFEMENAAATNMVDATEDDRTIAKNVTIMAEDQYHNICAFPKNVAVTCYLRYPLDATQSKGDQLPVLKDAQHSYLVGRMNLDRKECRFPTLELVAGAGKGDRLIEIVFAMYTLTEAQQAVSSARLAQSYGDMTPTFLTESYSFLFSTDQGQLDKRALLKADLDPLLEIERAYRAEKEKIEQKIARNADEINRRLGTGVGEELRNFSNIPESFTQVLSALTLLCVLTAFYSHTFTPFLSLTPSFTRTCTTLLLFFILFSRLPPLSPSSH